MSNADILATLDPVTFEPSCIVPHDDSEVVRHAAPLDDQARAQLLEQHIAALMTRGKDDAAVAARERRIAIEHGRVTPIRRRA